MKRPVQLTPMDKKGPIPLDQNGTRDESNNSYIPSTLSSKRSRVEGNGNGNGALPGLRPQTHPAGVLNLSKTEAGSPVGLKLPLRPGQTPGQAWNGENGNGQSFNASIGDLFGPAPTSPRKMVVFNRADRGIRFRPYDLQVCLSGEQQDEHFLIGQSGVTHVKPGEPDNHMTLPEWTRELRLFNALGRIKFFKHYLIWKAFIQWRRNVRFKMYCLTRKEVAQTFFLSKNTFAATVMDLHQTCYDLSTVNMTTDLSTLSGMQAPDVRPENKLEIKSPPGQEFKAQMDAVQAKVAELAEWVTSRAQVPDHPTMESLETWLITCATQAEIAANGPPPKGTANKMKMKTMQQKQSEQRERMRQLKRALVEHDMLGTFIRLVDYMAVEFLFKNGISTTNKILDLLSLPPDRKVIAFSITICLTPGEDKHEFVPDETAVFSQYDTLCDELVSQLSAIPRLAYYKPLNKYHSRQPNAQPVGHRVRQDHRFQDLRQATVELMQDGFKNAHSHSREYEPFNFWYVFIDEVWPEEHARWEEMDFQEMSHTHFNKYISSVRISHGELERMTNKWIGTLYLNTQKLVNDLQPALHGILQTIRAKLVDVSKKKVDKLFTDFRTKVEILNQKPATLGKFATFVESYATLKTESPKLLAEADEIQLLHRIAEENGMEIPPDHVTKKEMTVGGAQVSQQCWRLTFLYALQSAGEFKRMNMKAFTTQLEQGIVKENKELSIHIAALDAGDYLNPRADTRSVLAQLAGVEEVIRVIKEKSETYTAYQKLFELPTTEWTNLHTIAKKYKTRDTIWKSMHKWQEQKHYWGTTPIPQLDGEEIRAEVNDFYKKAFSLNKEVKDDVTEALLDKVGEEKMVLPTVMNLTNKALKKEHWAQIFAGINRTYNPDTVYTIDKLKSYKIIDYKQLVEEQAAIAIGEEGLEKTLEKLKAIWDETELETKGHRDSADCFIIGGVEEILQTLEDNQVTIQTCLASRFVVNIRSKVEEWDKKLQTIWDVIDEWVTCQKNWMYLEFIFSSDDIKRQLPEESRKFAKIDADFRSLTMKAHEMKNCLEVCCEEGVLEMLKSNNNTLDIVQKRLEDYLELKRSRFPRFYFLSNDELLNILSDVRNPLNVQPHLRKCFDNIKELEFKQGSTEEILGMVSGEDEKVRFSTPVFARGNVEAWLLDIEIRMRTTILDQCKHCQTGFDALPDKSKKKDWLDSYPAQAVLTIFQMEWTKDTEISLRGMGDDEQSVQKYYGEYKKDLESTVDLVRGYLTKLQRKCVGTLIVVGVHNRDTVEILANAGCTSVDAFEWNMQLRYYWREEKEILHVTVRQTSADFIYGYEYLGNSPRLVITALTDRAYLTCTGALHYNLGAAPQGPAGTGKTESVKDLGKALARQCVVFNCSDGLDCAIMGQMFSGLAQAGAWACFDEFNRIGAEVLSVIAQQMMAVTSAIADKATSLMFEGREIPLHPDFGVFITMNPGYAGRQELPDNLKALFRPVCLMVPDYGLIAEIMFYSEGFNDARTLAQKMQQLYRLSSEQLSKQDHYDFGMRAVKSILVMAGSLKRAEPDLQEDMVLIRAMRDSNIPKFLRDDAALFMALVQDLFPGVEIVDATNPDLDKRIKQDLVDLNYEAYPDFVLKVLQLHETMIVRHGVMLVGATYCGKTVCSEVLQKSLKELDNDPNIDPNKEEQFYAPVTPYTMNPKAVTMGELYGEANEITREWTDGILSNLARKACAGDGTRKRYWIVFDGPVDAIWIENMNTVLDDNKMLCLMNGERIKIPDTCTFCFEVQDLRVASPATVSRCGMVFLEEHYLDGGWQLLAKRMNRTLGARYKDRWFPERTLELLNQFVDPVWDFLRTNTKEYIPTVIAQMVESLLTLLESFIKNLDLDDDGPEKVEPPKPPPVQKNDDDDDDDADAEKEPVVEEEEDEDEGKEDPTQKALADLPEVSMDYKKIFDMYFCLSAVWGLCGNVIGSDRDKVHSFIAPLVKKVCKSFPKEGSVYDFCVHKKSLRFIPWNLKIPKFKFSRTVPFFSILVPTVETTIFRYFLQLLMSVERHVLVSGPTGVGKSQVVATFLLECASPESNYASFDITFSAQTSSRNLQERMESKLVKKRGNTVLGAPTNKKLIFFVDDLNMPDLEEYGASPPIELLRQVIDQGGLYDRKKIFWKDIKDLILITACGPPGGGRKDVTPRMTSKCHPFCFPTLGEESLLRIFKTIMRGFLRIFAKEVKALADPIVDATVEVYNCLSAEMRPTPARSHYTFNMRDLSKVVQGVLMITPPNCPTPEAAFKLWCHESSRVFHDRLIDDNDREWWWQMMARITKERFNLSWKEEWRNLLFGDYVDKSMEGPTIYRELPSMEKIQTQMEEYMMGYNVNFNTEDDLVFFDDAVFHLSRICRIFRQQRGNALLVGVGGSGRQCLTRMAAFMGDMKCFQIAVTRGYGVTEFREDLKKVLLDAGCDDKPIVFLLNDTQIAKEQFLEDINNVLNTGEVPNLMQNEDFERIMSSVAPKVKKLGKAETRENILSHFVYLCRENLHTVIAMSPIGDKFRVRLRMFPSLVNCMTIDWFNKWPKKALLGVANRFFQKVKFKTDKVRASVCEMCVSIHRSVQESSDDFFNELRRQNYTTPTSYLELINFYSAMLEEQSESLDMQINRYQAGLNKLQSTQSMVDEMKKDLAKMQPVLETAAKETAALMKVLDKDQKIATEAKALCEVEEKETQKIMDEAARIKDDCQGDLDKAMPAFYGALDALKSLNKKDIDEIKSFATPPDKVRLTLDAVMLLLKEKPGWDVAKKVMGDSLFLTRLRDYDKDNVPEKLQKQLQKWINDESFIPETIRATSLACMSLCLWVRAIDNYVKVTKTLGPKKAALAEAEEKLGVAKAKLASKQQELADILAKVQKLQASFDESVAKSNKLKADMETTELRLGRANKLVNGLASEKVRWEGSIKGLQSKKQNVVGNMVLAAGAVAYVGPFTSKYRQKLMEGWIEECKNLKIPVDNTFSLDGLMDPVVIRKWGIEGLPMDNVSIENGVIVNRARRWCLMIDPQGQANQWIKNRERENGLVTLKLNDPNLLRTLESCIRVGKPALLENVGETLDPSLDSVLAKQISKQGGRLIIRLGDSDVDYDPNFKFYVTTKLPNPHYMPELQIKTTIVNFTVTPKGLEDQLLVDVVCQERADLEEQNAQLVITINQGQKQLKDLEDKILSLLAAAGDDILDDEVLIETLSKSKTASEEINISLVGAEKTQQEITTTREKYRPVANRGSLVYTVISAIGNLEHMYQISLQFFKKLFNQTLEKSEKSDDVMRRIEILIECITRNAYTVICRGLFESDKLLYAFLLAVEFERAEGVISQETWDFFLRGSGSKPDGSKHPDWITSHAWMEVKKLATFPGFEGLEQKMVDDSADWEAWYKDDNPQEMPIPSGMPLNAWQKMLLHQLRPEKLLLVTQQMVRAYLGQDFTESPPFDLEGCYGDSDTLSPLIFVLSSGSDPTIIFLTFAEEKGFGEKKHMLSLGQGQGPKAEVMIARAIQEGEWVYLQNCHLCASWMPGLERLMEELALKEIHEDFRLWLTTMPSPIFPVSVLQVGLKITKEPPKGLRANLRDTVTGVIPENVWEGCSKPHEWKKLLFSLVYFHGIIQERRKFGPLGWNIRYEWNNSDLSTATKYLQTYLEEFDDIPWPAVSYMLGVIVYGGRVTDFLDLRCVQMLVDKYLRASSLEDGAQFTPDGIYKVPGEVPLDQVFEYLATLPQNEDPEVFGLMKNANITVQLLDSTSTRDSIISIQPRGGGGGGASTSDQVVDELAQEFLSKLVNTIDKKKAHATLFKITKSGTIPPLSTVLVQEVDRFNNLIKRIKATLLELRRAIAGEVILSSDLEKMYNDFLYAKVPMLWAKVAYPSLKPLGSWFEDLIWRIEFLRKWMMKGNPNSYWISGFFFPQGFMTGVLQTHSRRFGIPIDELVFMTKVLTMDVEDLTAGQNTGVNIHGTFMEGARWDREEETITESRKNVLYDTMPVLWVDCYHKKDKTYDGEVYQCPLYKTSVRAGILSTTGLSTNHLMNLEIPTKHENGDHWIHRGCALLCMLND